MRFPTNRPLLTNHSQRGFVWSLVLIEAVTAQHVTVSRQHMHSIFNIHVGEHLMRSIGDQSINWTNQPFARVEHMRERVLNRATTGSVMVVIDVAISGTISRKVSVR